MHLVQGLERSTSNYLKCKTKKVNDRLTKSSGKLKSKIEVLQSAFRCTLGGKKGLERESARELASKKE